MSLRRRKRPGLHDRDSHDRDGAGAGARAGSARSAAEVCGGPGDVRQRPRVQLLELLRASLNAEFWLTDEEVNSAAVRQRLLLTPVRHRSFATLEPGLGDGADPPKAATGAHAAPPRTADGASGRIVSRVGQRPPRRPPRRRSSAARGRVAHTSKEPRTLYTATGACTCTRSSRASAGPRRSAGLGSGSLSVER